MLIQLDRDFEKVLPGLDGTTVVVSPREVAEMFYAWFYEFCGTDACKGALANRNFNMVLCDAHVSNHRKDRGQTTIRPLSEFSSAGKEYRGRLMELFSSPQWRAREQEVSLWRREYMTNVESLYERDARRARESAKHDYDDSHEW